MVLYFGAELCATGTQTRHSKLTRMDLTDFAPWTPLDNQDERRMLLSVARGKNVYARQAK